MVFMVISPGKVKELFSEIVLKEKSRASVKVSVEEPGDKRSPWTAYIDGRDPDAIPPLTIMEVNVWQTVQRKKIVGQIRHGEEVKVVRKQKSSADKRDYFFIKHSSCKGGWVSGNFLSNQKHDPVGDQV